MRSTGKLHLGNYVGALENWVRMQQEYDCFFFIADWHALTTDYADTSHVKENSIDVLLDWLAAGLDPEKCVMFIQSHVPEHAELHLLLSMITPLGWLERVPTYKEQKENIKEKDLGTYGFLGYPVLQAADILIYKADVVPVGEDQVAHVELTREIARRFNGFYRGKREYVFPEPAIAAHAHSQTPRYRRTQDVEIIRQRDHAHRSGTGRTTEIENHGDRSGPYTAQRPGQSRPLPGRRPAQNIQLGRNHGQGQRRLPVRGNWLHRVQRLGCRRLVEILNPMQERRQKYADNPRLAWDILEAGSARARDVAGATMNEVRDAMGISLEYEPPKDSAK